MSNSSDPERYSIDEMMDRLNSQSSDAGSDEGKLVSRADGSKAIRVKRKKRRTHQEKDAARSRRQKVRMVQITAVILLLMSVVIAVGFATVYVNGAPFREGVETKIEQSTGANVEMTQFRMNPTSANAGSLELTWPDGNMLGVLSLGGLKAKVSPLTLFGESFTGQDASASRGHLVLRAPKVRADKVHHDHLGDLPIQFGEYTIRDFRFQYQNVDGNSLVQVLESEAAFIPPNEVKRPQLLLARGNVSIVGWPKFVLDRAHIEFVDGKTDVVSLRVKDGVDGKGIIEVSGIMDPYSREASVLDVSAESYSLSGLIGDEMGRLFSGRVDSVPGQGLSSLAVHLSENPQVTLSLQFRNALAAPVQLENFPFLFGLSQTLGDEWFSKPAFLDDVTGKIRRVNREVILEDLDFSFKGRMALKGMVAMDANKRLSGELEVGVTNGMIQSAGNDVLDKMFEEPKGGYRWIKIDVSGAASDPKDNFKQLYEQALKSEKEKPRTEIPSFENLTQPR